MPTCRHLLAPGNPFVGTLRIRRAVLALILQIAVIATCAVAACGEPTNVQASGPNREGPTPGKFVLGEVFWR